MDSYLYIKLLHIISATILAGTGIGTAFFMFMAYRTRDIHALAVTTRHVVLADWIFTTPAVIIQFITGIVLMRMLGYSFTSPWFTAAMGLFLFIGACWIPVVFIQYQLRKLALEQMDSGELKPNFHILMQRWTLLGSMAFLAIIILFWIMVVKPLPVS